ncbi:MAG: T9SS type A sorting domain-containing protein, partial [Dokdonia sp.]
TVTDGNFINIQNDITVNGTLTVDHQGSVVQVEEGAVTTNNGAITVTKTTPSIAARNYIAMSSPMSAETRDGVYANSRAVFNIIPSNFVPFTIDFDTFPEFEFAENFLDDDNDFLSQSLGSDPLPTPGIGQLVFPSPAHNSPDATYQLDYTQGTLNSGTISIPINYNGPATINNYNLLGNPYASAIDVEAFIAANDAVNQVYYWEHLTDPSAGLPGFGTSNFSMNDISVRNAIMGIVAVNGGTAPGQFMASGQGFGIKADQAQAMANTPVVFTNSIRVTGNNDDFRTQTTAIDKLWLNLTTIAFEGAVSQTAIGFTSQASSGFDAGYDSPRLGTFLSLFSTLETGEELAIQGREAFDTTMEILLGFATTVEENTTYTISIDHLEGIGIENTPVFLIDHLLGTSTDLKETPYTFTSHRGMHTERFTVVFEERDALGIDDEGSFRESVTLYPNPATDQVTLSYLGTKTLQNAVITDLNGKIMMRVDLDTFNRSKTIAIKGLASGMYFIQINSQKNTIVKKFLVR